VITAIGGPITLVGCLVTTIGCPISPGTFAFSLTANHLDLLRADRHDIARRPR
jgi:hypothetical protein